MLLKGQGQMYKKMYFTWPKISVKPSEARLRQEIMYYERICTSADYQVWFDPAAHIMYLDYITLVLRNLTWTKGYVGRMDRSWVEVEFIFWKRIYFYLSIKSADCRYRLGRKQARIFISICFIFSWEGGQK